MIKLRNVVPSGKKCSIIYVDGKEIARVEDDQYARGARALSKAMFHLIGEKITPKLTKRLTMDTSGEFGIGYLSSGLYERGYTLEHDGGFKNFTLTENK